MATLVCNYLEETGASIKYSRRNKHQSRRVIVKYRVWRRQENKEKEKEKKEEEEEEAGEHVKQ